MDYPISGIINETRAHPYTMLVLVGMMLAVPYTWLESARAGDVVAIQQQLADIHRQNLEQQLAAVQTELFNLTQQVNDKVANHKPVDAVYYTRINELSNEKDRLTRVLNAGR